MGRGLGVNPPLRSLWWRIPAALAVFTLVVLVQVNVSNALPQYDGSAHFVSGMIAVYIQMQFLPWFRWRR